MTGKRLEVNFWRVTMEEGNMRMRVGMVNGLSIRVRDFILASHAAACATAGDTASSDSGHSGATLRPNEVISWCLRRPSMCRKPSSSMRA